MTPVVIDASVMVKWFLVDDEGDRTDAVRLRDAVLRGLPALAPSLALYEVGNTLSRRIPEDCAVGLQALRNLPMQLVEPTASEMRRSVELVRRYSVTFYDAAYHALAIERGGSFVTADRRYLERAAAAGNACHLTEWNPH